MIFERRFRGLYAISPAAGEDEAAFAGVLDRCAAALDGGARILQYRNPGAGESAQIAQARRMRALCAARGAIFIVNDSARIAAVVGADGAHLGRGDGGVAEARALLGAGKIIGATCGDDARRMRAAFAAGADYCAFGAMRPSRTKPGAKRCSMEVLRRAAAEKGAGKIVAVGGIDVENAASILECGADVVAVCDAIFSASDVAAASRSLTAKIERRE